ncbi:TIR domain-containing protein [Pseudooceanicola sp. 200-1SW]|uniref:TIR domain-containing protein n=1 Tax=Pseudooceanicola sp. 200-1SW TaxID=3425949 RepID=UPI003D7FB091
MSEFFKSRKLDFFVSAANIMPGEGWLDSIRHSIKESEICILILTDENEFSRWAHFEAGAVAFNTKSTNVVPLLFTSREMDNRSPLRQFQYLRNSEEDILKLLSLIKRNGRLTAVRKENLQSRFEELYPGFHERVAKVLEDSVTQAVSKIPFGDVFPADTLQVVKGKLFFGAAMATITNDQAYQEHRQRIAHLAEAAQICCPSIRTTYWAGQEVLSSKQFDGEQVALIRDLSQLKESEACVFVIFASLPSSVLIEIGYAVALNKPILIFCKKREDLPFLLRKADYQIRNLNIYEVSDYSEAEDIFDKDGDALFLH